MGITSQQSDRGTVGDATPTNLPPCDVLIICAVSDEYNEVLEVREGQVTAWREQKLPDGYLVAEGSFATADGAAIVVRVACANHMGREHAVATASRVLRFGLAKCIGMTGICAGRRGKVGLGDVILADRFWSYDAGKTIVEDGKSRFLGDMLQVSPPGPWLQRARQFKVAESADWLGNRPKLTLDQQEDWVLLRLADGDEPSQHANFGTECPDWALVLKRLWQQGLVDKQLVLSGAGHARAKELAVLHPSGLPPSPGFRVHVGPLGSGAQVVEDPDMFGRLALATRSVVGLDMEASGLAILAEEWGLPFLAAKGVQDYGDTLKDDRYRKFAARASAECLIALLRENSDLLTLARANAPIGVVPSGSWSDSALVAELAEHYPDTTAARALWIRAGGRGSDVENVQRPRDLWQRMWAASQAGAAARPHRLLEAAVEDFPHNQQFGAALAEYGGAPRTATREGGDNV